MTKILLSTGGTGGHIFPILSLYQNLKKLKKIEDVKIITDERAKKLIGIENIKIIKSDSPFRKKGIIHLIKTIFYILTSTFKCFIFLICFNPKIIIGSGGYVSAPVLIASLILRKRIILYETNAILGRVNRLFLPYCVKLLSGYSEVINFPKKYKKKFCYVGQLVRNEFLKICKDEIHIKNKTLKILILGGSQGAKVFGEKLPQCFKILEQKKIKLSIKQQVKKEQLDKINKFYKENINSDILLFEFKKNVEHYIINSDIVICRSGSSTIAELSTLNKPFIAIPLPSSLDNHQYYNAKYYFDKNCCWLLDENSKNFEHEIIKILQDIYETELLLKTKKKKLYELNKKNVIENFVKEIFNNNGFTD